MSFDAELKRVFDAAMAELTRLSEAERDRARQDALERGRTEGRAEGWEDGREHGRSVAEQESRAAVEAAVAAVRAETASDLAAVERLLDGVRALDRARSLSEILDTLASCAAREVARAGVLLVREGRLTGWRLMGFETTRGDTGVDIALDEGGVIAEAVRTNAAASGETGGEAGPPRFAALDKGRESLAVPLALCGDIVAVLYADEGTGSPRSGEHARQTWPELLEILARHAARALEGMTALKAARAMSDGQRQGEPRVRVKAAAADEDDGDTAARRYARLLISEIKLYHEPEVAAGRRDRDLATRLGGEIARARVLYEQRVPAAVRERSDYFHDELVRTLADGDATLLQLT